MGKNVAGFEKGDRVVGDPSVLVSVLRLYFTHSGLITFLVRCLLLLPQRRGSPV